MGFAASLNGGLDVIFTGPVAGFGATLSAGAGVGATTPPDARVVNFSGGLEVIFGGAGAGGAGGGAFVGFGATL